MKIGERVRNSVRGREAMAGCRGAALTRVFALNCAPVHRFSRIFLAYLCVQHGVKRFGLIVQVLTAAGSLIQIHLLEPLKEEKCLCADKFGHIEGGGFLSGHW